MCEQYICKIHAYALDMDVVQLSVALWKGSPATHIWDTSVMACGIGFGDLANLCVMHLGCAGTPAMDGVQDLVALPKGPLQLIMLPALLASPK